MSESSRGGETARLAVRVQPAARQDAIAGRTPEGTLRVKVTAPALEGRANQAVEALLAGWLGLRRSQVKVMRGATSRLKVIEVAGIGEAELKLRVEAALSGRPEKPTKKTRGD